MKLATRDRVRSTRTHVQFYREHGWNVLPSDPTPASEGGRKKPLVKFRQYWKETAGEELFDKFPDANVQVMTGTYWQLAVLDLDGKEAIDHVERNWPKLPKTWTVWHSNGGRDSRHLWFRLPAGLPPTGKRVLYAVWDESKSAWKKHTAVELLLDRCLVVAPPSVHIRTGNEYRFEQRPTPRSLAMLPKWVWEMEAVQLPKPKIALAKLEETPRPVRVAKGRPVTTQEVLDAIRDKVSVARRWGLRVTNRPGTDGWLQCHDFNREDSNPSAAFHADGGNFWRPGMHKPLSLFDLGAELGIYPDWQDCRSELANEYLHS